MKIREDFVTNSSSSSYVLLLDKPANQLTEDEVRALVNPKTHLTDDEFAQLVDSLRQSTEAYGEELNEAIDDMLYMCVDGAIETHLRLQGEDIAYSRISGTTQAITETFVVAFRECMKNKVMCTTPEYGDDEDEFSRRMDYFEILDGDNPCIIHCSHH